MPAPTRIAHNGDRPADFQNLIRGARRQRSTVDFEQSFIRSHAAAAAACQNPTGSIFPQAVGSKRGQICKNGTIQVSGVQEFREHYRALLFYTLACNACDGSFGTRA
jgi:hypothetical protein